MFVFNRVGGYPLIE